MIERLSIKTLTIGILSLIGVAAFLLSVIVGALFYDPALNEQKRALSRVIEVAGGEVLDRLNQSVHKMGDAAQNSDTFRMAISNLEAPENKEASVTHLNEQFSQHGVALDKVTLLKLRIYSPDLKFLLESSEGFTGLPRKLPGPLYSVAKSRTGSERLKAIDATWLTPDQRPVTSVLVPIGALSITGYLELVYDPATVMQEMINVIDAPLRITNINNEEYFRSNSWPTGALEENDLIVDHLFKTSDGEDAFKVEILEDISLFNGNFMRTQIVNGMTVLLMNACGIFFAFSLFTKFIFKPLQQIVDNMERTAQGDLTVDVKVSGLKELQILASNQASLVENLREQVRKIHNNANALSSSADELLSVTTETNDGVQQQQIETSQVATAINEMSATVQEVSRHAEAAASAARKADEETLSGKSEVTESIQEINQLSDEIERAANVIHKLEEDSNNIGSVMDVIQGIAEQTNLLALNAAIEAARAGEQGRGFAVVADEVRVLASRTQESTQEIHNVIERLQSGAHDAVQAMLDSKERAISTVTQAEKAGESLETITEAVANISMMNTQIASAAEEQSAVASEIDKSIVNINQVADQTAQGAEHVASASRNLADLATRLQDVVTQFKI